MSFVVGMTKSPWAFRARAFLLSLVAIAACMRSPKIANPAGMPCKTIDNCLSGYRCVAGLCQPENGASTVDASKDAASVLSDTSRDVPIFSSDGKGDVPYGGLDLARDGAGGASGSDSAADTALVADVVSTGGTTGTDDALDVGVILGTGGALGTGGVAGTGGTTHTAATLVVTPSTFTFPTTATGTVATQVFTFSNAGATATSPLSEPTLSGASAFTISTQNCTGVVLAAAGSAGATCSVTVQFSPTAYGTVSATLGELAASGGSLSVSISGTGSQTFQLTVATVGNGSVASELAGDIACGSTCSKTYLVSTSVPTVTLFATPNANAQFNGWSGACSNSTGNCVATMSQARTVRPLILIT